MALKVVDNYFHTKKDAVGFAKAYKTKAKKGGYKVQTDIAKVLGSSQPSYLVLLRTQKILRNGRWIFPTLLSEEYRFLAGRQRR